MSTCFDYECGDSGKAWGERVLVAVGGIRRCQPMSPTRIDGYLRASGGSREIRDNNLMLVVVLGVVIEKRTLEANERAYLSLQQVVIGLYAEADRAVAEENYNDASLRRVQLF